jgi:hypothetical protein
MYPYMAPQTTKIHTPITLGSRHRAKPLVFKVGKRAPCEFDSHRPLHFSLSCVSLRCPRTRLSLSPSSHSLDATTTVPLIDASIGPSVEFALDGLIRPSSTLTRQSRPSAVETSNAFKTNPALRHVNARDRWLLPGAAKQLVQSGNDQLTLVA